MRYSALSTRHRPIRRTTCKCYAISLCARQLILTFPSLPTSKITNPDVTRIINSGEIQSVVRPAGPAVQKRPWTQKKNPLKNKAILFRLNPYAKTLRRHELRTLLVSLVFGSLLTQDRLVSQTGAHQEERSKEDQEPICRRRCFPCHSPRTLRESCHVHSVLYVCCMHLLPCLNTMRVWFKIVTTLEASPETVKDQGLSEDGHTLLSMSDVI